VFFSFKPWFRWSSSSLHNQFCKKRRKRHFSPLAVIGNVAVLSVINPTPWLRDPSNLLLACLAVSDMLVGVIVQPSYVAFRLHENHEGFVPWALRMTYLTTFYLYHGVSFPTLNATSYERFIALTLHLRYKAQVTKRLVIVVAALIWILNTFLTCLQFAGINRSVRAINVTLWLLCLLISGVFQIRS